MRAVSSSTLQVVQTDPEAAKVVFECGAPVTMIPLEVTHRALVTQEVVTQLCADTPFGRLMQKLLLFFADSYRSALHLACHMCPHGKRSIVVMYVVRTVISCSWHSYKLFNAPDNCA